MGTLNFCYSASFQCKQKWAIKRYIVDSKHFIILWSSPYCLKKAYNLSTTNSQHYLSMSHLSIWRFVCNQPSFPFHNHSKEEKEWTENAQIFWQYGTENIVQGSSKLQFYSNMGTLWAVFVTELINESILFEANEYSKFNWRTKS